MTAAEGNDQITIFSNTMAQLTTLGVRGGPNSLAIADVDKDGKPDIIVGCDRNAALRIFRNTSTGGTISFASTSITSGFISKLAVSDIDGDGKPDIASVYPENNSSNPVQKVSLFLNTSTGAGNVNFSLSTFVVNTKPGNIQLGDLNGDDKPDLVVSFPTAGKVTVYQNQSSGSILFDGGTDFTTTGTPGAIAIADMDADAKPEMVVGNTSGASVDVFKNNTSSGAFNFSLINLTTSFTSDCVLVNDFDGDGKNDIAIGTLTTNGIEILRNVISEPVITSFTPTGTVAGGTVTIQGVYLSSATEVSFGGTLASAFIVNSDGSITATVANGTTGSIVIKTPFGKANKCCYSFYRPPTFTSFSPAAAAPGATVTLSGTNFTGATQVTFGGVPATNISVNGSGTTLTATVGAGASGTIVVTHPAGNVSKTGFIFIPPPTIASFSPTSGKTGDEIIIDGNNFINYLGQGNINNNGVSLGGVVATNLYYISNTQIKVTVSSGASGDVRLSTRYGVLTLPGFTYIGTPTITSFTPTSGSSGDVITITGTNLTGATAVSFGGTAATSVTVVNATTITATLASGASGDVSVTTPGGTATLAGFNYVQPPPTPPVPVITGFTPASAAAGQTVTITGNNFTNASAVSMGGTAVTSFTVVNATTITAIVGAGASGTISVTTPGGIATLGGFTFTPPTVVPTPTAVVAGISPSTAGTGDTVIISGINLNNALSVTLGGIPVQYFSVVSATSIVAVVGAGSSGSVSVTTPVNTATLAGFIFREWSNEMVIYPNPVNNRTLFWVKHRADESIKWISVFDNTGKVVRTVPIQPGTTITRVFAGDLKSGYYQVAILGTIYKQAKTLLVW